MTKPETRPGRASRAGRRSGAERGLRVAASLLVVLAVSWPGPGRAHLGSTKLVWIQPNDVGAAVQVDLDPIDIAYALEAEDPDHPDIDALLADAPRLRRWAERVFSIRAEGGACDAEGGAVERVPVEGLRHSEAIRVALRFTCPTPVRALVFRDQAVFDSDAQHEAIVRVNERLTVMRVGRQEVQIGAPPSLLETLGTFLLEGMIHLVTGYDHVLFLLSLLLVAGEVAARDGRKKALHDVAFIVTAFTLGHSVTLIAAALDVVTFPSRVIESLIAASIIAVAVWNVVRPEARVGLRAVAAVFGLIHGFGFSSVLRDLVVPTTERIGALLAFNVGIELAQLAVVALVIPLLAWAGGKPWYRNVVVRGGSALIAAVALYWLVERVFDL